MVGAFMAPADILAHAFSQSPAGRGKTVKNLRTRQYPLQMRNTRPFSAGGGWFHLGSGSGVPYADRIPDFSRRCNWERARNSLGKIFSSYPVHGRVARPVTTTKIIWPVTFLRPTAPCPKLSRPHVPIRRDKTARSIFALHPPRPRCCRSRFPLSVRGYG